MYFIFSGSQVDTFSKVLVANAAVSALRLHQRVAPVQLSMAFLRTLQAEDSAHYLFFSLIFLYSAPISRKSLCPVQHLLKLNSTAFAYSRPTSYWTLRADARTKLREETA